ncbi:MAG TPA: hypothetical protein VKP59_03820 [Candidatus Thermoplasmatota archaeon]|nr:hypothetical protein [Candidatus Thermoplasmatota archaeon]
MDSRMVEVSRVIREGIEGKEKTEIWAKITDQNTKKTTDTLIWWEDDDGTFHDETPNLPSDLRDKVDNAWIEKRRHW